ncbi:hypothetical protein BN1184_BA_01090 [Pantoea ananatis]|nr:hypothetical protein BN1184_BA_01090 [Pantoea ananatis]
MLTLLARGGNLRAQVRIVFQCAPASERHNCPRQIKTARAGGENIFSAFIWPTFTFQGDD